MVVKYINTVEELDNLVDGFYKNKVKEIGLDFEGESNLHRYGFHLCLVQICDGAFIYIIDPVDVTNLASLKQILEDSDVAKIMCACDFDIKLLKETKKINIENIFDVHYGAKALGLEKLSLQNISETFLGVELNKSRKKQKANWNVRPLKKTMIEYAADDVRYLIEIKEVIETELKKNGEWSTFIEKCKSLELLELPKDKPPHMQVKGVSLLNKKQREVFKHIFYARDYVAQKLDRPVYQIIPNAELIKISKMVPQTEQDWEQLCKEHSSIGRHKMMLQKAVIKSLKK